jgi:hypothetical protein
MEDGKWRMARTAGTGFLGKFMVLKGAARELWLTFVVRLLVIAAYALTNLTNWSWLCFPCFIFYAREQKRLTTASGLPPDQPGRARRSDGLRSGWPPALV